ncbi:MAG: hypothetical protein M0R34_09295 [Candidatus Marinimicrobia bacterium]|nr:hypothetical protein [Candidatus Neomarinimicrobiota bacterium]MCK9484546.1 hypothetical protein [Candidatus Neomarinimicrobiota bacterium]
MMEINDKATLQQYIDTTPESYLRPLLATLYLKDKDYQKAIEICRQDLTIHPLSAIGHYIWALAAQAKGDIEQAVSHLQETVQIDAHFLRAYDKLTELAQGYLTPQQLKHYYEKICYLNPFDTATAAKLAALPADLESLADQMKARPPQSSQTEPSTPPVVESETAEPEIEPNLEVDPVKAAEKLSEFFDTVKKTTEKATPPKVSIPEEEAHLGPLEMPEPTLEPEPTVSFDEPVATEPPVESKPEPTETSSISSLFSRLREKPLEEVQKENWMQERMAGESAPESTAKPEKIEQPAESAPKTAAKIAPEKAKAPQVTDEAVQPEVKTPAVSASPAKTEETPAAKPKAKPKVKAKTASPQKKSAPKTKKNVGQVNNISFPIPTWTLVDVLTKQKLYEQALSILDIIEAKSKNQDDLSKVQKNRAEIIKRLAEEQAGEA